MSASIEHLRQTLTPQRGKSLALIGGKFGYRILMWMQPQLTPSADGLVDEYEDSFEKLTVHFGQDVFARVAGKTIIDFGSGAGRECVEFARRGAERAVGVELRENFRQKSQTYAQEQGVDNCEFVAATDARADIVYSLDSFEHFEDPGHILSLMTDLVKDDGEIWISFAWTWYHPWGGHLFSIFPWAHLVFTEECLIKWRSNFKDDGATKFSEVAGGLNQMTIARFEEIIQESGLTFLEKELRPIRPLRWLHNGLTREFTTALISARLKKGATGNEVSAEESARHGRSEGMSRSEAMGANKPVRST